MNKVKRKILSFALAAALLLGLLPVAAFAGGGAADGQGGCPVHTSHDEECGWAEAAEEIPCAHEHNDACGYAEAVEESPCTFTHEHITEGEDACGFDGEDEESCGFVHQHDDECGFDGEDEDSCTFDIASHEHDEECGYAEAVAGTECGHTGHDDACGYREAAPEQPCAHTCEECAPVMAAANVEIGEGFTGGTGEILGFAGHEWVVIGKTGDTLTLLSRIRGYDTDPPPFGTTVFNPENQINHYAGSTLQQEMAGIWGDFPDKEQTLIIPRNLPGGAVYGDNSEGVAGEKVDDQLLWPLSAAEAESLGQSILAYNGSWWWLRSPGLTDNGDYDLCVAVVNYLGTIITNGLLVDHGRLSIRPACYFDMSSVLFTSAASGPKTKSAVAVGSSLVGAEAPTGAVKLTVVDSGLSLGTVTPTGVADRTGRTVIFSYTGAMAGKTLSAIVTGADGEVKYYGKLAENIAASGTGVYVTLPDDFAATDTLQIFVEELSGDNFTDFASAPLTLTVAEQPTPPTPAGKVAKIIGVDDTMEYRKSGGNQWTPVTGTSVTGLAEGSYEVRYAGRIDGGTAYFASAAATVYVAAIPGIPVGSPYILVRTRE